MVNGPSSEPNFLILAAQRISFRSEVLCIRFLTFLLCGFLVYFCSMHLEKEFGEHVAEKRGWHWALTSFAIQVWQETSIP
jgi:hypothetical protein